MCPFEATSSLCDDASISSNLPRRNSSNHKFNEPSSSSDEIPMYIYIKPQICLPLSEPNTPSSPSPSPTTTKKRWLDQMQRLDSPTKVVVSICSATDEQQASIPSEEIQNMKDMISNLKHDPDSIYKRLCVRYDDDTIQRGKVSMEEMMGRVCARRVTDPGNEQSFVVDVAAAKGDADADVAAEDDAKR
ncbi:hypothetical protein ACHAWO_001440 [Cyclotella atomus]|uniref:Uncharacterized protein n=1 Tax=Cyclotella atomus TaxID=382360 RepID=A0ABD3NHE2_9STRA